MSTGEDDDLRLQRASSALLSDFEHLLPRLLRKRKHRSVSAQVRLHIRENDMHKACALIEPFQEDPQLLDTHLKFFIPPLVAAFLEAIQAKSQPAPKQGFVPISHCICYLLNVFCKVRGEKVIKGFFNNEPRYLEPILHQLEVASLTPQTEGDDEASQPSAQTWVERHILLLWLSHLLLAPFPLESMFALQPSGETSKTLGIQLPEEIPGISLRVLAICLARLQSASKERSAAASLLVRLCVRPDMQKLGFLHTMVTWSLRFFSDMAEEHTDIHQCLGVLSFLSGLVVSAANEEIGPNLAAIYQSCRRILDTPSLEFVRSSAVVRKLIVKTLRTVVIHCLQAPSAPSGLDPTSVLEEVIEFLLEALADGDTPVRYSASKALSIITRKLDSEMAEEVVTAILDSLTENIYWQGSKRNLNSVNPLRWHGLTLTLSHLLYRKAISQSHLPPVLNALLLSLSFEQRSPTGSSIGTNVRDASCFGIWALSRRYPTTDLLALTTDSIRASAHKTSLHIPQVLALELVTAACLDPAGNIRRGASAALQELIGRHPNTIAEGISLVQVVDFHAVGLRQRALCEVALKAAELHRVYWETLFEHLLEWRGTGSLDSESRIYAAKAVGLLSSLHTSSSSLDMAKQVRSQLCALRPREVEERQGFLSALSALARSAESCTDATRRQISCNGLLGLWSLFDELDLEDRAFTSPALRPGYTAAAVCNLLGALASMTVSLASESQSLPKIPAPRIAHLLNLCLSRHEEPVLEAIAGTTPVVLKLLVTIRDSHTEILVSAWLATLENESSYSGLRCSGQAVALGAAYGVLADWQADSAWLALQKRIIKVLTFRCTAAVAIEARTVALRALGTVLRGSHDEAKTSGAKFLAGDAESQISSALHVALSDYTITERGDVGSLVRLEALNAVRAAWMSDRLRDEESEWGSTIYADVVRLSLEKLDKMRVTAAHVLQEALPTGCEKNHSIPGGDVSSHQYFLQALKTLQQTKRAEIREAICMGYVSSAGMGSESVVQHARAALLDLTETLPTAGDGEVERFTLLDLANCLSRLVKANLDQDRVLLPLLEVVAFLFDMQVMQRLQGTMFSFRGLLSHTQKAHFKSTHMQKLHLALDVYRGLGEVAATRTETLAKVRSMLLHPFPKVRIAAAETVWVLTGEEEVKRRDWSVGSQRSRG